MMHLGNIMMQRTTVNVPDGLLKQAREAALQRGCSLSELVAESLREEMARGSRSRSAPRAPGKKWITFRGTGIQPGVDLSSSGALLDRMEHGCEWVTLDRGFARFPGLRWRTPID